LFAGKGLVAYKVPGYLIGTIGQEAFIIAGGYAGVGCLKDGFVIDAHASYLHKTWANKIKNDGLVMVRAFKTLINLIDPADRWSSGIIVALYHPNLKTWA
jgi:hypothetical protein